MTATIIAIEKHIACSLQVCVMDVCFAYEDLMKRKEKGENSMNNNGNEVRFNKIKFNELDLEGNKISKTEINYRQRMNLVKS